MKSPTLQPIKTEDLAVRVRHLWEQQWLVLASGDFAKKTFNAMTVGWGSLGVMWNRPFVQVVVRPTRYTFEFMEKYGTFTLCAFPEACRAAVQLLGAKSGRDGDKIKESGLTPRAASAVAAPMFAEAEFVLECRKIYWDDFDPARFLAPDIARNYPQKDYHRFYFGEIVAASATAAFLAAQTPAGLPRG